jgi:hypothetical protein
VPRGTLLPWQEMERGKQHFLRETGQLEFLLMMQHDDDVCE